MARQVRLFLSSRDQLFADFCEDGSPEDGLAGVAVGHQGFFDLFESGLFDVVLGITGPFGIGFLGQGPAGP